MPWRKKKKDGKHVDGCFTGGCAERNFRLYFRKELWSHQYGKHAANGAFHRTVVVSNGAALLEVHVRKDDAALVRGVVKALADPEREGEARTWLRKPFGAGKADELKALLASAPP